jgi:hypothetical protein
MHFRGDARDVIHLAQWARVYCFPPCFQQLRADENCLECKIADGRAFWGCAFVIWCICCDHADVVVVEQSDTIVHDFLDLSGYADVHVMEFRTSEYGDARDKFVRLTLRNATIAEPTFPARRTPKQPDEHRQFRNPDQRDRARSTWQPMPNTCRAVARLTPHRPTAQALDFQVVMAAFAVMWYEHGNPVPTGYLAADAQPPSPAARDYQQRRGPGDGRRVVTVVPDGSVADADLRARLDIIMTAEDKYEAAHALSLLDFGTSPPLLLGDDPGGLVVGEAGRVVGDKRPTHPPTEPEATGIGTEFEEDAVPPVQRLDAEQTVDIRSATNATALLIFVSVLVQPLVLAHADGFTSAGLVMPVSSKRPEAMAAIQHLCAAVATSASYIAFMVGEYANGVRVFTAPVDYRPPPEAICRSPAHRRAMCRRGAAFVWCTMAALAGTPLGDAAARAILSCEMFVKPVQVLADAQLSTDAVEFNFGVERARSAIGRPLLDNENSPPTWRALAQLAVADTALVTALEAATAAGDALLEGWAGRITPLSIGDVPQHLLENLPDFSDAKLDSTPLSVQPRPIRTAWLPLSPRQPPAPADAPACPRGALEMLTTDGRRRLERWLEATRLDLVAIRDGLRRGVLPADVPRTRPQPIAIGQSEMEPWARGRVWDCTFETSACCIVADFHAPILEGLARNELRRRLRHYPDQTLVANLLEGVRLDADVELQLVLVPHLISIAFGYESVAKELRRLEAAGWYKSFLHIPYFPMYFNGNGAVPRKLEDRWRRCVEGGGPRCDTYDASGLRAISINDASHIRHMPAHFLTDTRPEFLQWLEQRGLPPEAPELPGDGGAIRPSKWPKERKPKLSWVMRDMAIFGRAAYRTGQQVYTAGDDAKDYFSQMPMAAPELSKVGVMFLEENDSPDAAPRLRYISERVLGFGTHGASNIAQRLSDAIMVMYYEEMDEAEAAVGLADSHAEREWLEERLAMMRRRGAPCHPIRRFTLDPQEVPPEIAAPTSLAAIPEGYVCPELRLYSGYMCMYTDDNELLFVGVRRTLRGLRVWKQIVLRINLLMAIDEKRSLGTWCKWLGVLLVAGLGLVVVPKAKILRASEAIALTLDGAADFQTYRSLCGLLEHLLAVILRGRNVMHGLYQPHGPGGASQGGPAAIVVCDELMRKQLERWQKLLVRACGVSVKQALLRSELETLPTMHLDLTSDACYAEVLTAGIGGYAHGLYWYFPVPDADRALLSIPILEFLGVCFNILTFHAHVAGLGAGVQLVFRTDALTTARTLPEESMRSPLLVTAYQWLVEQQEWADLAPRATVQHCFGDCNPLSDLASRAKWEAFHRLCAQLGVKPRMVALADKCHALYARIMQQLRSGQGTDARPRLHASAREHGVANNNVGDQQPFAHFGDQQLPAQAAPPSGGGAGLPGGSESARSPSAAETLRALQKATARCPETSSSHTSGGEQPQSLSSSPSAADTLRRLAGGATSRAPELDVQPAGTQVRHAKRRIALGHMALPPEPPKRPKQASALLEAGRQYARSRLLAMTQGGEPGMALRADIADLMRLGEAVEELVEYGVNMNTWDKDSRAWDMWQLVCEAHGCSPMRTATEARDFPERNAHLLAALMFHAYATCKPRDPTRSFIKPRSAMAYPLAIIRIFARWSVPMPSYKMLKAALNGIARMYVQYHGPYSMAPRRSEPMKFSMVRALDAIPDGVTVGTLPWCHLGHDVFMFRRLNRVMIFTAFRLGEVVGHTSGEIMYYLTQVNVTGPHVE